jgi:Protein of unknown function (DUF2721)
MAPPPDLSRAIQGAVAPVVLISGVGLLLLTLTARLGRIVDRTRLLAREHGASPAELRRQIETQLQVLARRARLVRLAVGLSAAAIALIGVVVTVLFLSALIAVPLEHLVVILFVASLLSVVAAMLVFIRELQLALTALELELPPESRSS